MDHLSRRAFVNFLGVGGLTLHAPHLYASPRSSPRLLVVFLRGAYDSNHLLVPYNSDFYHEVRPNIAIAAPDPSSASAAHRLDAEWALAPALVPTLLPFWERKQLAFVPFAGIGDDLSRSHFATQEHIETGWSLTNRQRKTGFLARLSGHLIGVEPIAFTQTLPAAYRGAHVPNISLKRNSGEHAIDSRQSAMLVQMYSGTSLKAAVEEGVAVRAQALLAARAETMGANRSAPSAHTFEQESRRMARMMRENYRLGFVDVGGWDTHVNQGEANGPLAKKLARLGEGLAAYCDELGEAEWKRTVVLVLSEFGRTFKENGNKGTDHGHGTTYWLMGGGIQGGRMFGEQVDVTPDNLLHGREYPVLNDYRNILGGLFQQFWGLSRKAVEEDIFSGSKYFRERMLS